MSVDFTIAAARLTDLGKFCVSNPAWRASGATTHCNQSVQWALGVFGCHDFDGQLANKMLQGFAVDKRFHELHEFADAQQLANSGRLVIAGVRLAQHGHVCFLVPDNGKTMADSASYGERVPFVANVGPEKFTGIKPLSYAFSVKNKPKLWLYEPNQKVV